MKERNYPIQDDKRMYLAQASTVELSAVAEEYDGVQRTVASRYYDYSNLAPGVSGRPGLTRSDYSAFRPNERIPTKIKDIIKYSQEVYKKVGLIRNIIDLMGDFTCQGVRISHPDPRVQKFYRAWFERIDGVERSERFANNLYRTGNIVIRRQTASINLKQRAKLFRAEAKPDMKFEDIPIIKAEIPWRYVFLNPATVDVVGDEISNFVEKKQYVITFPPRFQQTIINKIDEDKELLKSVPKDMLQAIRTGGKYLLPKDKTRVFHYKKDDWEAWATPMTYAILDDIVALEKLKLCDMAAMDGAISNIRIFSIGSLDPFVMPGPGAVAKLKRVLSSHVSAGTIDLVWGPDIKLIESKTNVHQFLGEEKYKPTMNNIFIGLGVPSTLTGAGGQGTTNNFISLKTLIERLEYGRKILLNFWDEEIKIVQKAMGFTEPANIEFDYMNMGDDAAEKALYIQLWDRHLMSDELIQEKFGSNVTLEEARITRENKERDSETRAPKSGQFFDGQPKEQLKRIALQKGYVKPQQVGLTLQEVVKNVKDMTKPEPVKTKIGVPGRPKNAKDGVKRKQKVFKPKAKASINLWASEAQTKISEILNPFILKSFGKANLRKLTDNEAKSAEKMKFGVLFNMEPFTELTKENIEASFELSKTVAKDVNSAYQEMCILVAGDLNRQLTLDEMKSVQIHLYNEVYNDSNS